MNTKNIKLFLRLSLGIGFLSAVADRIGLWPLEISSWGNWESFLQYTAVINPYTPESVVPALGVVATAAEVLFGICLIIGFKTELFAKLSGWLLLLFALAMTTSIGLKKPLDFSVYVASAAAFALSSMKEKYLELDLLFSKRN